MKLFNLQKKSQMVNNKTCFSWTITRCGRMC